MRNEDIICHFLFNEWRGRVRDPGSIKGHVEFIAVTNLILVSFRFNHGLNGVVSRTSDISWPFCLLTLLLSCLRTFEIYLFKDILGGLDDRF